MALLVNLAGRKFGELKVLERAPNHGAHTYYRCECSCGKQLEVEAYVLMTGRTRSCHHAGVIKHGHTRFSVSPIRKTPEYIAWDHLVQFERHRPGSVCEEWLEDFQRFLDDIGPRPTPEHRLCRLDTHGEWEQTNVEWREKKCNRNRKALAV